MTKPFQRLRQFLSELKRRNVYRVGATYLAVAFIGLQAVKLLIPSTTLPAWGDELILAFLIAGFPVALVVAWAFEMTPEGVRRTEQTAPAGDDAGEGSGDLGTGYRILVGLGLVAAAAAGSWYLTGGGGSDLEIGERSVAVLPFESLGQEEAGTFTEGMHSDLQTKLANIAGLTVSSSRAVDRYRGSDESTAAVARDLGVSWIVSGDVQRMGDQIQVNVRLLDPDSDTQAWTDSYRRDLTAENLFAIQTDITMEVARALEAELSPGEAERVERQPTGDLDAYRLYAEGRRLLSLRTARSIREAQEYFERALRQDSTYARAWAGLADARVLYVPYSPYGGGDSVRAASGTFQERMREALPGAEEAAERALALAPDLAEAHTALGAVHFYRQLVGPEQREGLAALEQFVRAVELKPSYAHARQWLGDVYLELGRPERAVQHTSVAVDLDPGHAAARQILGMSVLALGDTAGARKHLFREHPHEPPLELQLILYYELGRWEDAGRLAREAANANGVPLHQVALARIDLLQGDTAAARERLAEVRRRGEDYGVPTVEGLILAALGRRDDAFEAWSRIRVWGRQSSTLRYYFSDVVDPLRDDPRFRELMSEASRAWGLEPDGSLPDSVDVGLGSAG